MENYKDKFNGRFIGIMLWEDCETTMMWLAKNSNCWYFYDTQGAVPKNVSSDDDFLSDLAEIKAIMNSDNNGKTCGSVFVDELENPNFVKIFDPRVLGKACGDAPAVPRWLISKIAPDDINGLYSVEEKTGF